MQEEQEEQEKQQEQQEEATLTGYFFNVNK